MSKKFTFGTYQEWLLFNNSALNLLLCCVSWC